MLKRSLIKNLTLFFAVIFCSCILKVYNTKALDCSAKAFILYCPENNKIILEKNSNQKLPIASTTKIMTALLTLETAKLNDECVKITNDMLKVEGSSMGLKEGDILPLTSLAKGMLCVSGNDSANAAAIALCGTLENFSKLMNLKAKELNMKNTNFVTPSGLDAKDHYSTAYDLALLASFAIKNKDFLNITSKLKLDIPFKEPDVSIPFYNENKLLKIYKGCAGIKTGYTKKSGRCLVSLAEKNNFSLIAVTLDAPNDWNDHIKLFDYGFNNFKAVLPKEENINLPLCSGKSKDLVTLIPENKFKLIIPFNENCCILNKVNIPKSLCAPLNKGEVVGSISYLVNKKEVAKVNLITAKEYSSTNKKRNIFKKVFCYLKNAVSCAFNYVKTIYLKLIKA